MNPLTKNWLSGFFLLALVFSIAREIRAADDATRITTDYINAKISLDYPGFAGLSADSLGQERFPLMVIMPPLKLGPPVNAERKGSRVEYRGLNITPSQPPRWAIEIETNKIELDSRWSAEDSPEPLELNFDGKTCHATLLGLMDTNGSVLFPAILHFPGQGTFRISAEAPAAESLGYSAELHPRRSVQITFPAATRENPSVKYVWQVVSICPAVAEMASDPRLDGFRRNWLNIFQLNPLRHLLANNVTSDSCGFCYYEYGDIAEFTPSLTMNLTALDIVRQTLDRIIAGTKVCGMPGYTKGHEDRPACSADTLPSFLITAEDYVRGAKDEGWLAANYNQLKVWTGQMLATDRDGDGLVKYILSGNSGSWPEKINYRPANWWDTIGFGYEDAYANALAYRALDGMAELAQQSDHAADGVRYRAAADKLKAVYFQTFYDPATGILAGWRSADGQLHDYYFPWVTGIAIHYGLVPQVKANSMMDTLLAKMHEVGYTNFALGLPGNLIPVLRKDYVDHNRNAGGGTNADGSDGFQIYENGGATACFAYYTLAALYDLGRIQDGDRILLPMLDSFAKGDFQGFGDNKRSRDWKTWNGEGHGYEGFLNDNYYALLAVLDRQAAVKKQKAGFGGRAGGQQE